VAADGSESDTSKTNGVGFSVGASSVPSNSVTSEIDRVGTVTEENVGAVAPANPAASVPCRPSGLSSVTVVLPGSSLKLYSSTVLASLVRSPLGAVKDVPV
jgi:hypothetical protein